MAPRRPSTLVRADRGWRRLWTRRDRGALDDVRARDARLLDPLRRREQRARDSALLLDHQPLGGPRGADPSLDGDPRGRDRLHRVPRHAGHSTPCDDRTRGDVRDAYVLPAADQDTGAGSTPAFAGPARERERARRAPP